MSTYLNLSLIGITTNGSPVSPNNDYESLINTQVVFSYSIRSNPTPTVTFKDSKGTSYTPQISGVIYNFTVTSSVAENISYTISATNNQGNVSGQSRNISWVTTLTNNNINNNNSSTTNDSVNISNTNPTKNSNNSYSTVITVNTTTNAVSGEISISINGNGGALLSNKNFTSNTSLTAPYTHILDFPITSTTSGLVTYNIKITKKYGDGAIGVKFFTQQLYYNPKLLSSPNSPSNSSSNSSSGSPSPSPNLSPIYWTIYILIAIITLILLILLYKMLKNNKDINKPE